jgi:hypothetical protein
MKLLTLTICTATLLLFACNNDKKTDEAKTDKDSATSSSSADSKKEAAMTMPDSATAMKNWQNYMTPGEMHKMMASWDGTWTSDVTMWEKEGAAPQKSMGTAVNKMVMGGLYQESMHSGNMMGMPFQGHSITGYDNAKKVFVSSWIDNMGSGIMTMEGPWDAASKSITMKGKAVNPSTGKDCDYTQIMKVVDDNTQTLEMYGPGPDGKNMKMMEITFKRKK